MEKKGLFDESVLNKNWDKKVDFFRLGPKNRWKEDLEKGVQKELEDKFIKEMTEIGYL